MNKKAFVISTLSFKGQGTVGLAMEFNSWLKSHGCEILHTQTAALPLGTYRICGPREAILLAKLIWSGAVYEPTLAN